MHERYPGVQSALDYHDPFTLVVCVMLSAQTTDAGVNRVTPELFSRWPTPQAMAQADPAEVGEVIHSIGFWRAKAAHCVELSQMIMSDFGGEVPHTMEELCRLPGVGRKTANIVLNKAFGICEGIAVDTHVFRIATRMGFTRASTPDICPSAFKAAKPARRGSAKGARKAGAKSAGRSKGGAGARGAGGTRGRKKSERDS